MNKNNSCNIKLTKKEFSLSSIFDIPEKGILGIYGPSGSGKTTLLRCLAGLEKHTTGTITINNRNWLDKKCSLPANERHIGYVFQEGRLFPHINIRRNLDYGKKRSRSRAVIEEDKLIELLDIGAFLQRMPHQLSGGEKQRVAIARALLSQPELVLMDEPLASLDETRKAEILPYLDCLHDKLEIPMVYVSHSLEEISRLCDHLLILDKGAITFTGNIHQALVSPSSPIAKLEKAAALLEGNVYIQEADNLVSIVQTGNGNKFFIPGLIEIGSRIRFQIKAGNVSVSKARPHDTSILNIIEGEISNILDDSGTHVLLQLNCRGDIIKARITKKSYRALGLEVKQPVLAQIKSVSIQSFN